MKRALAAAPVVGLLLFAAQAQGEKHLAPANATATPHQDLGDWVRPLGDPSTIAPAEQAVLQQELESPVEVDVDVADAHWMALTMWGEARGHGTIGLRAVGHVIHNRWRAGGRYGDFVTDTVSQAFQFSCWNPGDPNHQAMLDIEGLPRDSEDYRMWLTAKQLANEILAGQSDDPTGGALFYHTDAVSPKWSQGLDPLRKIGNHLFFLDAH